ncbi:ABC transporter permease [Vagococcus coleopterorum]|uniref:ABC transporter permease n=1 Tax=Vagococcus coleopterorum TaxID=2714946 RepID=A0A6G8AP92_9ENTE|nr:ABC transporter permease [Vagococcus coleopterorum]QIL46762.1 ABC transporter permease [Vagococcus coleopterorum]
MMLKLSLTNVKKRWQDYLVLMMGLIISVAIFYMFQTVSLNTEFLKDNIPSVQMVSFVFQFGAILLGIITVVYIMYANSFLLSMRKKEYGMYMLLGAKKRKISQMIAIETIFIGLVSMFVGVILGTLLAIGVGGYLTKAIDLPSQTYVPFVPMAIIVTVIFFGILFVITTIMNVLKFKRSKTLELLYSEATSERKKKQPVKTLVKFILSLVLLAIGYYAMAKITTLQLVAVPLAIFTITPGTFLFFSAVFPTVVEAMKNWKWFSQRKLKMFTLSQLSFKASSLTKVLGLVTMLLALSLGAVTVGQSFGNFLNSAMKLNPNDAVSYNPTAEIKAEMAKIDAKESFVYHVKATDDGITYREDEVKAHPLLTPAQDVTTTIDFNKELLEFSDFKLNQPYTYGNDSFEVMQAFSQLNNPYEQGQPTQYLVVSESDFDRLEGETIVVNIVRAADFKGELSHLKAIEKLEKGRTDTSDYSISKYQMYQEINSMSSGFMFMGFFLGIAFLAMLASCLMFKILSGAYQDVSRYKMLDKMGVRRSLLSRSVNKEILIVFGVPAIVGVVHVLFGLKMFSIFLGDPYKHIAMPFILFGVIYFAYYLVTVILYKRIVLPKKV